MQENRENRLRSIRKATKARLLLEQDGNLSPEDYRFISQKRNLDVTAEFKI